MNKAISTKKIYVFYVTFWAILAIFPEMTDFVVQTYKLYNYIPFHGFFTPLPWETPDFWIITGGAFVLATLLVYLFARKNRLDKLEYLSVCVLRYSLAFVMIIVYGYAKVVFKQFQVNYTSLDMPLRDVSDLNLTWYFFGRSNVQTFMYGLFELLPGMLLLFRRTTLIGALLLFPTLANIFLVNLFNHIEYHTLLGSIVFLCFDIGILLYYRTEMLAFFTSTKHKMQNAFKGKLIRSVFTIAKLLFICLIVLRFGNGIYTATTKGTELSRVPNKCFGIYEVESILYNNKAYVLDSLPNYWTRLYFEKVAYRNNFLKDKKNGLIPMYYEFYDDMDSIKIVDCTRWDEYETPIDTNIFKGTYMLSNNDSILTLHGIRNDTLMTAVYKKVLTPDYDWWW